MFCNFRVSTLFQLICQGNIFHSEHLGRVICKIEMKESIVCDSDWNRIKPTTKKKQQWQKINK